MNNRNIFITAIRMIPEDEKMDKQMVSFVNKDLYFFSSSRSCWFHISSFIEGDSQFSLPAAVLLDILQIGKDIKIEPISEGRVYFKSGTASFETGVITEVSMPPIEEPTEEFKPIHDIFSIGSNLLKMVTDGTCKLNAIIIDEYTIALIVRVGSRYLGGVTYTNPDGVDINSFIEGNFSNTFDIISSVASRAGHFHHERNMLYLRDNSQGEASILSCIRLNPPMVQSEITDMLNRLIVGDVYKNLLYMEVKISVKEYLEVVKIATSMATDGSAIFNIEPKNMTITVADNYRREYKKTIPCESELSIKFTAYFLNSHQINHIMSCTVETKKMEGYISIIILPSLSRLIYLPESKIDNYNSFVITSMKRI